MRLITRAAAGVTLAAALAVLVGFLRDLRGDLISVRRTDDLNTGFRSGVEFAKAQERARADALIQALNRPLSDPLGHGIGGITELEQAAFIELSEQGARYWEDDEP